MIQFKILSGKRAGTEWVARRFPVRVGRAANDELQLEDAGVWENHLQINFNTQKGFLLTARPDALAVINGQPLEQAIPLRNGDTIEIGSAKIQFWLAATWQTGLRVREWATWAAIGAICLGQVALVYWLLQ